MSLFGLTMKLLLVAQFHAQVLGARVCGQRPIDVIFLIDGSRSVRASNFQIVKNYVKNFTQIFAEIGPKATQIGLIQFASSIREEISLAQYPNRDSLMRAIDNVNYMKMGTMTGEALKYLVTVALKPSHGSRLGQNNVRTVALVITDGKSQDYHRGTLSKWQRKAKELGVEFFAIGVGQRSNEKELLEIASEPKAEHKFYTDDFNGIREIALQLRYLIICESKKTLNLTLSNASLTSLTARWTSTNDPALIGYEITYYRIDENSGESENEEMVTKRVGPNISQITLPNLHSASLYHVILETLYKNKEKEISTAEEKTASLSSPAVEVVEENATSVRLRWSSINHKTASWTLSYHPKGKKRQFTALDISGESNDATILNLSPSTIYKFEISGNVVESGIELASPSGKTRARTKPLLPPSLACERVSQTTVSVSFDDVANVVTFMTIKIHPQENQKQVSTVKNGRKRLHLFEHLLPGTTYVINSTSHISQSNVTTFSSQSSTKVCSTKPNAPRDLRLLEKSPNSLTFQLDRPVGGFESFIGECLSQEDGSKRIKATFSDDLRLMCDDLDPSTQYEVQLAAVYKNLTSDRILTKETTSTPPPSELKLSNVTTHSLVATWKPPEGLNVELYYVTFNFSEENTDVKVLNGSITSTTINHLEPDTFYIVQVQAVAGEEESFAARNFATTKPEIFDLRVDAVTYTAINVSWNPSSVPQLESYCLKYTPAYSTTFDYELMLPSNVVSYSLTDLETATKYRIALNGHYPITRSEEVEKFATTLALPPTGPINFTEITESSFVASWLPPETNRYPVKYIVTYTSVGGQRVTINGVNTTSLLFDKLESETDYDVTVRACYPDDLVSQPIEGETSTSMFSNLSCSCSTYLNAQSRMQNMMEQMMGQIVNLEDRIRNFRFVTGRQKKNRRNYIRNQRKKIKASRRGRKRKKSKS